MKNKILNERDLIKKIEKRQQRENFEQKKEMYLKQTDRNYKDGDRN